MPALYLSAPGRTSAQDPTSPSVSAIHDSGIAPGYAFASTELPQIQVGMTVVVFSRDPEEQLEAKLEAIGPNGETTGNGRHRCDLYLSDSRRVPYTNPPKVNHCGVGFAIQLSLRSRS